MSSLETSEAGRRRVPPQSQGPKAPWRPVLPENRAWAIYYCSLTTEEQQRFDRLPPRARTALVERWHEREDAQTTTREARAYAEVRRLVEAEPPTDGVHTRMEVPAPRFVGDLRHCVSIVTNTGARVHRVYFVK